MHLKRLERLHPKRILGPQPSLSTNSSTGAISDLIKPIFFKFRLVFKSALWFILTLKERFKLFLKKALKSLILGLFPLLFVFFSLLSLANEEAKKPEPNMLEQFFPFIIIGLVFYFLLIRPQQRRSKDHKSFLSNLKNGDEILTSSGIYGKIEGLTDEFVILEIAEGTKVRILKSQIHSLVNETKNQVQTRQKARTKK